MFDLVDRKQHELRLLLSLKLVNQVHDTLLEMEQVTQRLLGGYGEKTDGISLNMGALYLGYLLMGNKEQFVQARDDLLKQEQDGQALSIS